MKPIVVIKGNMTMHQVSIFKENWKKSNVSNDYYLLVLQSNTEPDVNVFCLDEKDKIKFEEFKKQIESWME